MKCVVILCLIVILVGHADLKITAQPTPLDGTALAVGDKVLVSATKLSVYTHPTEIGPMCHELIRGMSSRLLKMQTDQKGDQWLYLSDNVHGWVRASLDNQPSLVTYSDAQLNTIISDVTKALKQNNQSVDDYLIRAIAYDQQRDFKDAGFDFKAAIQILPNDARLYYYRAILDGDVFDYQQQVIDSQKAIDLKRILAFGYSLLGLGNLNLQNYDEAVNAFTQATQIAPDYGLPYYGIAGAFTDNGQDDEAITNLTSATQHDPLYGIPYGARGRIYETERQYDKAQQDYEQAILIDPYCSGCYVNRGSFFAAIKGDQTSAINDFNKAIQFDPYGERAYANRGVSYEMLGNHVQAIADLERATQLNPTDGYAFFSLGAVYAAGGQYPKAIDAYTTVETLNNSPYVTSSHLYRAQLFLAVGNYNAAISDLDSFIGDAPGEYFTTVAHLLRGESYLYENKFDNALADYKAVTSNSSTAGFAKDYYNQGGGFRVSKRYDDLTLLEAAVRANPKDATSVYALATLYMEFGLWSKADQSYQQYFALVKTPIPDSLTQLLQLLTS